MRRQTMDLGNKLRILRYNSDKSKGEIARTLGISEEKYCGLENNQGNLETDKLNKLFKLYNISPDEFYQMKFPIIEDEKIPTELLKNLENVMRENSEILKDWNKNRERFQKIKEALDPVLDARGKFFDMPELDLECIASNEIIVKQVNFDMRCEILIDRCLKLMDKYLAAILGDKDE